MEDKIANLRHFQDVLIGMPVSHIWRGHGSALFLEFGNLSNNVGGDGKVREPTGELGVMIEWSWRIEHAQSILCGSWSDEALWQPTFDRLLGRVIVGVDLFARIPELTIAFKGNLHLASFMTA